MSLLKPTLGGGSVCSCYIDGELVVCVGGRKRSDCPCLKLENKKKSRTMVNLRR